MGMFDTIHCEYPLPAKNKDFSKTHYYEFQTKSLDSVMDNYFIDEAGQLWIEEYDIEDHSDTNATTPLGKLSGMMTKTNIHKVKSNFSGDIIFYASARPQKNENIKEKTKEVHIVVSPFSLITFKASFIDGKLQHIYQVDD